MAYRKPNDLDGFIQMMPKADMRVKALLAEDLVTFLSDESNSIVCMDLGMLVDGLMPWLTGSHFKIAQKSLEAFSELIKRLGPDFNAYNATVLPHVIDRLGDSKDTVREKAQLLLQIVMEYKVLAPQTTIDKLAVACFKHKNAKVREEFLQTIVNTLNEYGTSQLSVRTYIQPISALLGDPTATVRDAAIQTLVEIYKHVGDRLRADLRKMDDVPTTKLAILEQKFDQIKAEGLLLKSALQTNASAANNGHDESDNVSVRDRPTKIVKRTVSSTMRSKPSAQESSASSDAGAVTAEIFESTFEIVPQLTIFHPKDMDDIYRNIIVVISDKNADWEKRIDSLKKIRSLLMLNIQSQPQFVAQLKDLSIPFLDILKEELRSQVIREACITIAYMAKTLRNKFEPFCVAIMEALINLIQNSAKVIASSSNIALRYIIKYAHSPKMIKLVTDTLQQSKSKDIRAALCEMLCLMFDEWPTKPMERCSQQLRDVLKRTIADADNEARRHSRRAYWKFRRHFPELADQIYTTLDIASQRALERERDGGNVLIEAERRSAAAAPRFQRSPGSIQKPAAGMRSVSAVDTAAAQRAKARAQYSFYPRKKLSTVGNAPAATSNSTGTAGTASLPRPRYMGGATTTGVGTPAPSNVAIAARTRGRAGVSQSQPGSRSTSPSSKLREPYGYRPITGTIPKKASGIPRSLTSSRETSPTRVAMKRSIYSKNSATNSARRTPERSNPRSLSAARILPQSREAESALADALSPESERAIDYGEYSRGYTAGLRMGRKLLPRDESDDSEASSVCSERSFDSSMTRGNNSNYSLSGSRNRLDWSCTRAPFDDIDTIIQYCDSSLWSERKDGVISLTQYLADGNQLTPQQLQAVLDMFRKIFVETHTKVYSLFLEAVTELILTHANELQDWLFVLLTRLFNKLGMELLNSMHIKINKTLQVVHEYFPPDQQLRDVFRILADTAQTPCTKTKIAILKFLTDLATNYCKSTDFPSEDGPLAVDKAVLKIVQQAGDPKSKDLRDQARKCLIALYNRSTPQMTKLLSSLPKGYQDTAKAIIQSHLRRSSTSGTNSPSSPHSSASPKPLQSPSLGPFSSLQPQFNTSPRSRQSSVDHELYSEADVQHNIHKTSEEIRNCFGVGVGIESATNNTRQYHSLSNANGYNGYLHDQQDSCASSNSKTQSATTTESNTPESTTMRLDANLLEQHQRMTTNVGLTSATNANTAVVSGSTHHSSRCNYTVASNGEIVLESGLTESEIIRVACGLKPDMPVDQLQQALANLEICIKGGNCELPNKHFRAIMKMLLGLLESQTADVMIAVISVLGKIVRSTKMKDTWINFLELILLRIINCYPHSKETAREIDLIIPRIVSSLPLNATINIVNPVIATSCYPMNLCAVKLLTELADRHGAELTEFHLDSIFPNLARLTDDSESMVRKAAVFCIVKLYIVMGEEKVKPKLSVLNPSKVRLLNVYIDKQRGSSGGGSSTKNSSASSS
ncbi:PREDICTED: CLIP-associating protein [Rhagoletis zephyria]|uniref:CLIP-associating protein n=1 Tax=Rhagoletis zephyria TaxID=28612 RepID=UPI0008115F48|nr:PREDICTED: CLIP-associating protein [Rhagoletis zephyria]XP_017477632.1 PREDICTED: CLIP-associating protein [Rhagoletis zephyria]XP_017477633.1 PREDICTED: CLIP-associating protein [Rhagoletis zephyria]XP_017477634.1 PREDICTED: CLIP-associating protein [Rhagoletis zephyria]XP_017477635.1 PREDICTED: CLIP-associating protein [Rhagoletis zephyria]XP_017477636.1 PREDICTED: CLIP-associating protein [Rhagoletis zephyria]